MSWLFAGLLEQSGQQQAGGGGAYTLTLDSGSYTRTGVLASVVATRKVTLSPSSYAITGVANSFKVGRGLTLSPSSYTRTGVAASFFQARKLTLGSSSYTLTGFLASVTSTRKLTLAISSYSLTGSPASFFLARKINLASSSYTYTGFQGSVKADRSVNLVADNYTIAGYTASTFISRTFIASPTTFTFNGVNASLTSPKALNASPTSYSLTGQNASVTKQYNINAYPADAIWSLNFIAEGYLATLAAGRNLALNYSSYSLTGSDASFSVTSTGILPGSFAITGSPVTCLIDRKINAYPCSIDFTIDAFLIDGYIAKLQYTRVVDTQPGSYSVTGSEAILIAWITPVADPGTYTLTGNDAAVGIGKFLNAESYNGILSSPGAELTKHSILESSFGSYDLQGSAVGFELLANLEAGIYIQTGYDSNYIHGYNLFVDSGVYSISGAEAWAILNVEDTNSICTAPVDTALKYDIDTGRFVKILSNKICLSI